MLISFLVVIIVAASGPLLCGSDSVEPRRFVAAVDAASTTATATATSTLTSLTNESTQELLSGCLAFQTCEDCLEAGCSGCRAENQVLCYSSEEASAAENGSYDYQLKLLCLQHAPVVTFCDGASSLSTYGLLLFVLAISRSY